MATDAQGRASSRPRPWLLVLLAVAIVAYVLTQMFSGGAAAPSVPTTARPAPGVAGKKPQRVDPEDLKVRLDALELETVGEVGAERNPFRFQPKAPPPMPSEPPAAFAPPAPVGPVTPPGPPPIGNTIKFIGIVETGKVRIGAFSYYDEASRQCTATFPGREGEIIEGRYRIVRIGVESAVLEYLDGTGRTTLPLNGQACVNR